jgi:hypothetical protein
MVLQHQLMLGTTMSRGIAYCRCSPSHCSKQHTYRMYHASCNWCIRATHMC